VAEVTRAHPAAAVAVWAEDEHRLGLLPVVRRVWAPRGRRPTARVERRYEWLYVYGFVRPSTGRSWWGLLPTVSAAAMAAALAEFARDEGVGPARRAVLVVDRAGWHAARELVVPEGIHFAYLPAYSPELQPAERLWPLVDEAVANRAFPDLAALEESLADRCRALRADPTAVRAHTRFAWWPDDASGHN
jgi:DDE superfamily endonuclease